VVLKGSDCRKRERSSLRRSPDRLWAWGASHAFLITPEFPLCPKPVSKGDPIGQPFRLCAGRSPDLFHYRFGKQYGPALWPLASLGVSG
jgi:hypothetical protein